MDLGLAGKTFIVTGASSGLGKASAVALVGDGANVVVSSRDEQSITMTAAELGSEQAIGIPADNADRRAPARLVATANAKWGWLDGALISVGGPPTGTAMDTDEADWRTAFETVLLGGLRLARAIANGIGDDGGSIAFVLSTSVKAPLNNLAISNGLRPGLAMIAKSLADELGPRNIRVNGLLPGRFDTPRLLQAEASGRHRGTADIPLGRHGQPDEFGKLAAFVLSPAAGYITGSVITVDGGATRAL